VYLNHHTLTATAILLFCITACQSTSHQRVNDFAEKSKIKATIKSEVACDTELQKNNYQQASANLKVLHENYEKDKTQESKLWWYLDCYVQNNLNIDKHLNDWIKNEPNDPFAYLARGIYFHNLAGKKRGDKWIHETSKQQINGFTYYSDLAISDLENVIKFRPKTQSAYWYLIEVENGKTGISNVVTAYFTQGQTLNTSSYVLMRHYLMSLRPRWGGSYKQMNEFIDKYSELIELHPDLNKLRGAIDEDIADLLLNKRQYNKALYYFNESLAYGEEPNAYNGRAIAYYRLGNRSAALKDINRAIEIRPTKYMYHMWKYWIENNL